MKYFESPAGYRFGNYCPPLNATALDILLYEIDFLGNIDFELNFNESGLTRDQLSQLDSSDVIWVCGSKDVATQYNNMGNLHSYVVDGLQGCAIICGNNEEGYLVIKPSGMLKLDLNLQIDNCVANVI